MIFGTGYGSKYAFRIALTGMILTLCLCVNSWGACVEGVYGQIVQSSVPCFGGSSLPTCNGYKDESCYLDNAPAYAGWCLCSAIDINTSCPSSYGKYVNPIRFSMTVSNCPVFTYRPYCDYGLRCDTEAEADSVANSLGPQPDVPENCQEDYSNCMALGGVWEKIGSDASGCSSTCNFCNSKQQIRNLNRFNRVCCQVGMAPPQQDAVCVPPPPPSGRGMTLSVLIGADGQTSCGALSTEDGMPIEDNTALYKRFCIDGEEYEEQVDTNSIGSSSGGAGEFSSSSVDVGTNCVGDECLPEIYGVLDTIRDTLVKKLAPDVEGIKDCLYSFRLCAQLDSIKVNWGEMPKDSSWLRIDTTLLKYIRPLMDSSVALDSHQLKVLRNLDTNMLKQMGLDTAMLKLDSAMLRNDSSTRKAIVSGDSGIMKRVGNVDTSVRRLDSSLTKSLGGIDTTLHGLDSSLNRGVHDGIDSLIDSMSRYIGRADSSIRGIGGPGTPLGDSLGHILGVLGGIDSALSGNGTALGEQGYSSYGSDSSGYAGVLQGAYGEGEGAGDSAYAIEPDSCTSIECMGPHIDMDSVERAVRANLDSNYQVIADSSEGWFTAIRENLKFVDFDSVLVQPLQSVVPNTNTCPADCFKISISNNAIPGVSSIDYGVCKSWNIGGIAVNALIIVRLILRIITAVTCIYIGLWYIAGRKN